jgi:HD-GYP domain-containing protein (c-di-GMP phosphodiesterase class II)
MFKRIKWVADAGQIVRALGISMAAMALGVYAMLLQERRGGMVVLAAVILLLGAGAVLQVGRAVRLMHGRHKELATSAARAERHYFKVLVRILQAIEARDRYHVGRGKRVGHMAFRLAVQFGLDRQHCKLLRVIGQVADLGMVAVPERVLNKALPLGGDECRTIRLHPEKSYRILEPLTFLRQVLPAVRYHHERCNGTGYPRGLKGGEIPVEARLLAVADAYEAMTHDRPNRPAMSQLEAVEELRRCSPEGFDAKCVKALEEVLHISQFTRPAATEPTEDVQPQVATTA